MRLENTNFTIPIFVPISLESLREETNNVEKQTHDDLRNQIAK